MVPSLRKLFSVIEYTPSINMVRRQRVLVKHARMVDEQTAPGRMEEDTVGGTVTGMKESGAGKSQLRSFAGVINS